jgi:Competence protein CoiA-like family
VLVALNSETERRIYAPDIPDLKKYCIENNLKNKLICPLTSEQVFSRTSHYRGDTFVRGHFVMQSNIDLERLDVEFDREYFKLSPDKKSCTRSESPEHLLGKEYLRNLIKNHWEEEKITDLEIVVEYPVKITGKNKRRIIDVAVLFKSGFMEAHEVQLSSLTVEEINERSEDYRKSGIDSFWWFGEQNFQSQALRNWHRQYYKSDSNCISFRSE